MTEPLKQATCPRCGRKHDADLQPNARLTVECACGKLLTIQRGNGYSLVVMEMISPLTAVTYTQQIPEPTG